MHKTYARDHKRQKQQTERETTRANKAFADEVLPILQEAWVGQSHLEIAETKAERLACVLAFMLTLVKESIVNQPPGQAEDHPRSILAHEALRMLGDIIHGQDKHAIHDFFDGLGKAGHPTSSLDVHRGAIMAACVRRAREIGVARGIRQADVIRIALRHPGLAPYLETESRSRGLIDRTEAADDVRWLIDQYYEALKEDGGDTISSVVDRAAYLVGLRHKPLDMREAVRVLPINLVIAKTGGSDAKETDTIFSALANGKADVKLVEVTRGQWRIELVEKGAAGYRSVQLGHTRQPPKPPPAITASQKAPR